MADGSVTIGVYLDTTLFIHELEMLENRITGLGGSMSTSLSGSFSGKGLFESVNTAFTQISTAGSTSAAKVKNSLISALNESLSYFDNASWEQCGNKISADVANGLNSGIPRINAAISNVISIISKAMSSGWENIGHNIAAGIASGMTGGSELIKNAANTVAKNTSDEFKKYYQISSPSALMRDEIGIMISRGIAEGITDGASFVSSALGSVYGATDGIMSRSTRAENDNRRTVTQNIYLRDSDYSPYRTAKKIKRESEAILGI